MEYVDTLVATTCAGAKLLYKKGQPRIGGEPLILELDWPEDDR